MDGAPTQHPSPAAGRAAAGLLIVALLVTLVRTAWLCDDAHITLRTCWNIVQGHGPVWNVGERVQAYTHPLWMMLCTLALAVTGELPATMMLLSIIVSMGAVVVLWRGVFPSEHAAIAGLVLLLFSKAFIDYSTSGLENPLTHLLLAVLLLHLFREPSPRDAVMAPLLLGLLMLNRPDLLLLAGPMASVLVWRSPQPWRRRLLLAGAGFLPLALWELFSLLYYGFLFPNTAYAKLGTGIGRTDLFVHGILYIVQTGLHDPLTILTVFAAPLCLFWQRDAARIAAAAGVVLHVAYVARVGGDFMLGRFFAAPFLIAVVLIAKMDVMQARRPALIAAAVAAVVGFLVPVAPVLSGHSYGDTYQQEGAPTGALDERAYYIRDFNLLDALAGEYASKYRIQSDQVPPHVLVLGAVGYHGLVAGPKCHVLDAAGLADPLLARLPIPDNRPWRIGHFFRAIPAGYAESLASARYEIHDPAIRRANERLRLITSSPRLLEGARLRAIASALFRGFPELKEHPSTLTTRQQNNFHEDWSRTFVAEEHLPDASWIGTEQEAARRLRVTQRGVVVLLTTPVGDPSELAIYADMLGGWAATFWRSATARDADSTWFVRRIEGLDLLARLPTPEMPPGAAPVGAILLAPLFEDGEPRDQPRYFGTVTRTTGEVSPAP